MRRKTLCILIFATGCLTALPGCDTDWRKTSRVLAEEGEVCLAKGDLAGAEKFFLDSLRANPYGLRANRGMMHLEILEAGQAARALAYCRRVLDLVPPETAGRLFAARLEPVLEKIVAGGLEHPSDALEDIFFAARTDSRMLFLSRMSGEILVRLRGKGRTPEEEARRWFAPRAGVQRKITRLWLDSRLCVVRMEFGAEDSSRSTVNFQLGPAESGIWLLTAWAEETPTA